MNFKLFAFPLSQFFCLGLWKLFAPAQSATPPMYPESLPDDQGICGSRISRTNPHIIRPTLDAFADEASVRFYQFSCSRRLLSLRTRPAWWQADFFAEQALRDHIHGWSDDGHILEITICLNFLKSENHTTGIFWEVASRLILSNGSKRSRLLWIVTSPLRGMGQSDIFTTFFSRRSSYFDPVLMAQ